MLNYETQGPDPPWQPLHLAVSLSLCHILAHLLASAYIAWRDLTGQWDSFVIDKSVTRPPPAERWQLYKKGFRSFLVDTLCFQCPALWACITLRAHEIHLCTVEYSIAAAMARVFVGYHLGRCWAAFAHRVLHLQAIYRFTHKRHHVPIGELVASGAFQDSIFEYCFMEVPAMTLLILVMPPSVPMLFLFFSWHGFSAASDHAGMSFTKENNSNWIHRFFFDGEYHYWHHKLSVVNYAESEWIDKLCGTHHSQRLLKFKTTQQPQRHHHTDNDLRYQRGRPP